ncbi:protein RMD9, mitochondrial [Scheffersomyces coipomensis]|uniref:protein RMD9, mitochondrial n=1 Tax=Scheffersomyces coipomensis TaxID=1788519 RepID=UPI00315D038A
MFRLISTNAQQGFRPVILSKVRPNKGSLALASNPLQGNTNNGQYRVTQFSRSNSTNGTISNNNQTSYKVDNFINKATKDPLIKDSFENSEVEQKLNYFRELLSSTQSKMYNKSLEGRIAFNDCVNNLFELFDDEAIRSNLTGSDLFHYAHALQIAVFYNRTNRLSGNKNRDRDQHSNNYSEEMLLKNAVLNLAELIIGNEFQPIITAPMIQMLFYSMLQFKFNTEIINLWENGINDKVNGKIYLSQEILGIVLPTCFENNRFTYEEILQVYELNTKDAKSIAHNLAASIGKIAITSGDYSRALDSLESLLQLYENQSGKPNRDLLHSLSELHLTFIGHCKDYRIAKHFFDKVIEHTLPYKVILKAPKVVSFLQNCNEANEPIDNIIYIWKSTINYYKDNGAANVINARYSILNNGFFQLFFNRYPNLNQESFIKLREVISSYSEIKLIDETFLNTIISNYSWADKSVLNQLIENYSIYEVNRTPVSYRVSLKKMGELKDYSNQEILEKWNENLQCLESNRYNYIPVADWAALRDATIASPFPEQRTPLYLTVVNAYKNYMQDRKSCLKFLGNWSKRPDNYPQIARITTEENPDFNCDVEVVVPQFKFLRSNVDYKLVTKEITDNKKNNNDILV